MEAKQILLALIKILSVEIFALVNARPLIFRKYAMIHSFYDSIWVLDHTGSCYIEETGESYQLGESWQPDDGKCWQKTCHDFEQGRRQNTFLVSITT